MASMTEEEKHSDLKKIARRIKKKKLKMKIGGKSVFTLQKIIRNR